MSSLPLSFRLASTSSGLCTSTPAGGAMSAAVTAPGPCLRRYIVTGSSCSDETTSCLRFKINSVTSSRTPGIVENSCRTPSTRMEVTAAPGIDDSSVRRSEFPRVYPKPGSSGSMPNPDRGSFSPSSDRAGRWAISTVTLPSHVVRYMTAQFVVTRRPQSDGGSSRNRLAVLLGAAGCRCVAGCCWVSLALLLRVLLDDQLLLNRHVDLRADRKLVDEDAHL